MGRDFRRRPSRARQVDRALTLLDRIITLLEVETEGPLGSASELPFPEVTMRSPYWRDRPVRDAIVGLYLNGAGAAQAASLLLAQFGADRAPGKSVLGRIYVEMARARAAQLDAEAVVPVQP